MKNREPEGVSHAATSGLRLAFHAAFAGSIRPGLNLLENRRVSDRSGAGWYERENVREGELAVVAEHRLGGIRSVAGSGAGNEAEFSAVVSIVQEDISLE